MKTERVLSKVMPVTNRIKRSNRFPLKLKITFKSNRRYYATGYDVTMEEWEKINSPDVKGKLRNIRNDISVLEKRAQKCLEEISGFTFDKFENLFFEKTIQYTSLKATFEQYIEQLRKNNQLGTASSYRTTLNSLLKFKSRISYSDINKEFLESYERWLMDDGKSLTTVGIYIRTLRTIINIAIDAGIISHDQYPFGKRKYIIPTGRNVKKALNIDQIKMIFNYPTEPFSFEDRSKDFWIFSYLCNGINMMDIVKLRKYDTDRETITFEREKTKRVKRDDPIKIVALRNEYIDAIIRKWGTKSSNPRDYLFDIAKLSDDPDTVRKKAQQLTQVTNKWMRRMGESLGFELKVTTYVARHSFATILVRSGAPLEFACQSLGHTSILTTQKYFAGFDLRAQAEYTRALVNF